MADIIRLRVLASPQPPRWALNLVKRVPVKRRKRTHRHSEDGSREHEGEAGGTWPHARGHLQPQKLEEGGRTLPWSCRRVFGPAGIPIPDFWPPEQEENTFLWF